MFDFEWTGRNPADENDRQRGINAAQDYCALNSINPAKVYAATCTDDPAQSDVDAWSAIEGAAISAMCSDRQSEPENVSLIWL